MSLGSLGVPTDDANPAALVEAMMQPGFYEHRPEVVRLHETHISWVFVAGPFAYKVKKALHLPFLDYGSLARRRLMCHEEVRLNRRLAPDLYLGVRAIVPVDGSATDERLALGADDDPRAVEHAVEMRTIDPERTLDRLTASESITPSEITAIGSRIAAFHRDAEPARDPDRAVSRQVEAIEENHRTLEAHGAGLISAPRLEAATRFSRAYLTDGGRAELERRAAGGMVRDGHGDLRAEHVIVAEPIRIYDCVEFDPGLRIVDVAADLAFLLMDLERLGDRELAERVLAAYREAGGPEVDRRLLAFFCSYRAWVRSKVALLGAGSGLAIAAPARELLDLGHRFAWRARPPLVLFVCGLAASGKSTLAAALGEISGLPVIDADTTRKRLVGLEPTERASSDHYSPEVGERTYRELGVAARAELDRGSAVIVDATARRQTDRDAFREGLGRIGGPVLFAICQAPDGVLLARARERSRDPARISDADEEVVRAQLGTFERIAAEEGRVAAIATELDADAQLTAVEALIDEAGPARGAEGDRAG